jgi:hypothetical protein
MSKSTPGPWGFGRTSDDQRIILGDDGKGRYVCNVQIHQTPRAMGLYAEEEREANARLIVAAPDHALICWAMCVGTARWEPFGDGRGEFCMNGLRHATTLDEFGCPVVTHGMREAIRLAQGASPSLTEAGRTG